jgi:hypothetical protein
MGILPLRYTACATVSCATARALTLGVGSKPIIRKKFQPSYQEKFGTYLNDIVLPALEKIQSALLCPEPNNSGEIENINSSLNSMPKGVAAV